MKTYKLLFSITVSILCCSCQKYLDVKENSSQIFITTASQCQLLLDNYSTMNTNYPTDQETSCDDYYLQGNDLTSQTGEDQDLYKWSSTALRNDATEQWTDTYYVVYNANLVLETLAKLKGGSTDPSVINALKGAALFYRSFAFWQMIQLYTRPYSTSSASQYPGIPLRLSSDLNDVSTRGTVQQSYDQVVNDLKEAVTLLPSTAVIASRPSKAAAYAMLARIYLTMGNYADALTSASSVLNINGQLIDFNSLDPGTDFPFTRFNKEELFHAITVGDEQIISANYALIDSNIVSSYEDNDLRRSIYLKSYNGGYYFTGNYEPSYTALFNGLATDEVYLTRAECYARTGNVSAAMTDLNALLVTRWKTGTYTNMTATSADDALSKILVERRKELIMRSTRWTDLRRLNQDSRFAITLERNVNGKIYTLPSNDLRYTLEIPEQVILNSSITQNPR